MRKKSKAQALRWDPKNRKKPKPIYVKWIDSSSFQIQQWRHVDDFVQEDFLCSVIETVGYLIYENKEMVNIVLSASSTGNVTGDINIPKAAILKRKWIRI